MNLPNTTIRHPYLDWLRIIVVAMLIPFHTAMTFAPYPWYLRNGQLNHATQGLVNVLDKYHMELLFLITGAAIFFSLNIRSTKSFIFERIQRLVIPLIFGMLVSVPPCYWIAARQFSYYTGTLWEFYPLFWKQNMFPFQKDFSAGALWFLWYLVFYTIALSPILIFIKKKLGQRFFDGLSTPFENPIAIFVLVIPIALVQMYSQWVITGDFLVLYYAVYFVYGFFLFSAPGFEKGLNRSGPWAIAIALITMTLYMMLIFPTWDKSILGPEFWTSLRGERGTAGFNIFQVLMSFCSWSWIISLLYLARKFLNFSNRFTTYGNEVVLPFYIIHSTAIALIGWWIIHLSWEVLPKYALNVVLAFMATAGLCEIMRRTNVSRFFLGMRLKKQASQLNRTS
jgi:glucan biosynthesis protein C